MAHENKNFRSAYYEKVGCRSVEEKKSLEILLKDKPINKIKLKQFCLRFTVPAYYRSVLWNLLLGVFPTFTESHEYVMSQRLAVYKDLLHALQIMRIVDDKTPKSRIFHAMWLLENKRLYLGYNIYTDSNFVTITETLVQIFENDAEAYWISKGFYELICEIEKDLPKLIEFTLSLLEKEDATLYKHLENINVLNMLPLQNWYTCCFAGILSESAIIRIWDKICGGSIKILVFVLIILFTTLRRLILRCSDIKSLLEVIDNVKEEQDTADLLVNKAIELWQQNKGHSEFLVHRKDNSS